MPQEIRSSVGFDRLALVTIIGRRMGLIDSQTAAERLARVFASDLCLYNEAAIEQGIREDNLFESLAGPIEEYRKLYRSRVSVELTAAGIFERMLVDTLLRGKETIPSLMW